MIRFYCECGRKLSAPAYAAGQPAKCSHCGRQFTVPAMPPTPTSAHQSRPHQEAAGGAGVGGVVATIPYRPNPKKVAKKKAAPRQARDYTYLVMVLAMTPLIWSVFLPEDAGERLDKTLQRAAPHLRAEIDELKEYEEINGPLPDWELYQLDDDFYRQLPGGKIQGAMLGRTSAVHWLLALLTAAAFFGLILTFFPKKTAKPVHLLYVGLFTGIIGIVLLSALQLLSDLTRGWIVFGGGRLGGLISIPFWFLKLIAGSYDAALDPNSSFFASAFGSIACIGLLVESVKVLPLAWHYHTDGSLGWRGAILWGLASGVGFGVTEGIMYSGDFYNGIWGADAYIVRFVSCVALHAIWSASAALFVYQQRDTIEQMSGPWGWISGIFGVIIIPMFLHGIYDTLLKKEMEVGAIVVAVISFGVLAAQMEVVRKIGVRRAAVAGW